MSNQVVLLYGEDTFYIKSKIKQLIKKHEVDDFNTTYYDLEETTLGDIIGDALTIPFMSDNKVVVCQNAYFLGTGKHPQPSDFDIKQLKRYLEDPPETTVLIIMAPVAKLDQRKSILKSFEKHTVTECKLKTKQDLTAWAKRQVGKLAKQITNDALNEFIARVEHSTEVAYLEMKKLLAYAQDIDCIDAEIIKKVVTKNVEDNVFEITNALLMKNHKKALEIYHELILYSEDPLRILSIIIHKYREILHVQALLEEGLDQNAIQDHYRVSSGRAYYMLQNAKSVSKERLREHLTHLEKIDYDIKSGRIDKKVGLELFILSI